MQEIFDYSIFGNTVLRYLESIGILVGALAALYLFKRYIVTRLEKWADSTETTIDDLLVQSVEKSLIPILYFGSLYAALHTLAISQKFEHYIDIAAIIVVTLLAVRSITTAVTFGLHSYLKDAGDSSGGEKQIKGVSSLANFLIWALALVFILDNLGVRISAVVAGLGIGGVAVALAAQAVLGDLFSYFVIFFDKPFVVGDFIVVGDKMGTVEYVGIKTTRLRAIGGEQLVFSNTDLTNSRVHNFKKMERRRVVFKLGVTYQTPLEKLKAIPQKVREIIVAQDGTVFDRGHFASYGASSLDFEFVYFVSDADYAKYMDIQQAINLAIFEAFEKERIEFAFPTQTLFVNKVA